MEIQKTNLKGVYLIQPDVYTDFRGDNVIAWDKEVYSSKIYTDNGILLPEFVEHNLFSAFKGCLVGLHYSPSCWKIYQVVHGTAYYVFAKMDEPDFGKWQSFMLSDKNHYQLVKPPNYASGFLCISDTMTVHVMQSEYYDKDSPRQTTLLYNDSRFKIWWPCITEFPIQSRRDEIGDYEDGR